MTATFPQLFLTLEVLLKRMHLSVCIVAPIHKKNKKHAYKYLMMVQESAQSSCYLSDNFDDFYVLFLFMAFEEALTVGLVETVT